MLRTTVCLVLFALASASALGCGQKEKAPSPTPEAETTGKKGNTTMGSPSELGKIELPK
jgi:hypothetical protein